ncbi:MAG: cupin domain-containing protein [Solirubrobacteraceae bacterium]
MADVNVLHDPCAYEPEDPEGYRSAVADIGKAAGGRSLAVKVYELPQDQSVCPYHYEYEEEWLLVLSGSVLLRTPTAQQTLQAGAIVCFEPGPTGAHKLTNREQQTARLMMFSSAREPAVAVYPDSDKIGVWPGDARDNVMLHRADGRVDYFEGERS